jgi:hypothetical protein
MASTGAGVPAGDAARPRRFYLHVGLPKTGTSYLQGVLAQSRPRLRELGYVYPFVHPEGMFHAAVELRGQYARWGLEPSAVDGTWEALCRIAGDFAGSAVVSHELLGGATPGEVSRARTALPDTELHLVVTVRDLARQVGAHWQEQVKNGRTYTFAEYAEEVLHPARSQRVDAFWTEQDLPGVLARWSGGIPPDRVHVVVCPPRGTPRDELWRRFAAALGLDPDAVELPPAPANDSLGAAEAGLLRRVNLALGGRLEQPRYAHVVKRFFAQRLLAESATAAVPAPEELRGVLTEATTRWQGALRRSGCRLHGRLEELAPVAFEGRAEDVDAVPVEQMLRRVPGLLAELMVELHALRQGMAAASRGEARRAEADA